MKFWFRSTIHCFMLKVELLLQGSTSENTLLKSKYMLKKEKLLIVLKSLGVVAIRERIRSLPGKHSFTVSLNPRWES